MDKTFCIEETAIATGNGDAIEYSIVGNETGSIWAKTFDIDCAKDMLEVADSKWSRWADS